MNLKLHFSYSIVALMIFATSAAAAGNDPASKIGDLMQAYHELGQFNGTALVVDAGSVVFRKGYGLANREWQIKNSSETRFLVGSITKSFTALVVLKLEAQGELSLDATISTYLPEYRKDTGDRITLRHLLTHTDGIPNYTDSAYFWRSFEHDLPYTTAEFVFRYCSSDLEFEPGSQYRYGNAGYSILGAIIERVTGDTFGDALAHNVLRPLDMSSTGDYRNGIVIEHLGTGYEVSIDSYRRATPIYKPLIAAGSLYTSVDDLLKYDRALNGSKTISAAVVERLFDIREGAIEGTFAYGWNVGTLDLGGAIGGTRYMATNGEINGFHALMIRLPDEQRLIVLLNNTGETNLFEMATNVVNALYDLPVTVPEPRPRDLFRAKLRDESIDAATDYYRQQRAAEPDDYLFYSWPMRILAGQLMRDGKHDDAVSLLQLNIETNPDDARSFELLAEAQLRLGRFADAKDSLEVALSLDPSNEYVADMIFRLRSE